MDKNDATRWKILQIMPAQPGWRAVYAWEYEPNEWEPGYDSFPIIGWALVEDIERRPFVVALSVEESDNESIPDTRPHYVFKEKNGFLGYNYPGCEVEWMFLASTHRTRCWDETEGVWKA